MMKKKAEEKKDSDGQQDDKYNLTDDENSIDIHDDIADKIDKMNIDQIRNLDQNNPMEHAIKYDMVKHHMPKPDYMKVEVHEEQDDKTGEIYPVSESEHKDEKGNIVIKKIRHFPFFVIDLNTAIAANVAQVPMNVVPNLIDMAQDIVWEEKKAYKPEKRKEEFNYWWIIFILLIISGGISMAFMILSLLR